MADLNYTVAVNTKNAQSSLNGLEKAIAGIGLALGAGQVVQFADSITSLGNRLRTITPDAAQVEKQFQAIAGIAINARAPLEQVGDLFFRIARASGTLGISMSETATITDSLAKAISASGISAAEAAGPLLQLGQALQSGRFQGDELRSILEGMPIVTEALAKELNVPIGALRDLGKEGKITGQVFVDAMKKARDGILTAFANTVPTITGAFEEVKTASKVAYNEFEKNSKAGKSLAISLELLAMWIYKAGQSFDEFSKYLKVAFQLALVAANFFLITKAIKVLGGAFALLKGGGGAVVALFKGIGSIGVVLAGSLKALAGSARNLMVVFKDAFKSIGKTASYAWNGIKSFFKNTQRAVNATGKVTAVGFRSISLLLERLSTRFGYLGNAIGKAMGGIAGFIKALGTIVISMFGKMWTAMKPAMDGLIWLASGALSFLGIDALTAAIEDLNDETSSTSEDLRLWRLELDGLKDELSDVVSTTNQVVIATASQTQAINSAAQAYHDETKAIIDNLKLKNELIGKSDEEKRVLEALSEEGQRYRAEELRLMNALADAKADGTDAEMAKIPLLVAALQKLQDTHQGTLDVIKELVVANTGLTNEYNLQQYAIQKNIDLQNKLTQLQSDTAVLGLSTLEKAYYDVDAAATAAGKAAIEAEEARLGAPLDAGTMAAYYAAAREGSQSLKDGILENYEASRTFETGWKESMNSYVENITSSANLAKSAFESMTSNMESSIDDFVDTGKFSFGDLAKSIIKDIQKMILKMVIFNALKAAGTAFGIPGFAEGGNVKAGGPIMVGEKGPELFVPPSSGRIIPNNQLGKGGSGAAVSSAPITNNYITNNIQALDSRSVAQVFADNRKSLLGTVRMAENEMPY